MSSLTRTPLIGLAVLIAGIGLVWFWNAAGRPTSRNEAVFLHRLNAEARHRPATIDLRALMPGDWQLVCDAHCYSGDLYLSRFDRSYPPVSACHDGAWGLLFIDARGDFVSAAGGADASISLDGCRPRQQAVLQRVDGRARRVEYRAR